MSFRNILFLLTMAFGYACQSDPESKIKQIPIEFNIDRFEQKMMACQSKAELAILLQKYPSYSKSLYRTSADDTALVAHIYNFLHHPESKKLYDQTQKSFGDLKALKSQLTQAFQHIKYYYPNFKTPKIMTTFTGLENDFFVSDSLIIIALEPFLGPKALYRPNQPAFLLRRYTQENLVPNIVRFLSNSYIKVAPGDQSFTADMVFFGKALEFTKVMMPTEPDSLIMGYTNTEMTDTWNAQDLVWAHIIDKNLLFTNNVPTKEKYFGERPYMPEIGPKCPGRIGQWLGWRIIQRYRTENPKVSFQELMANDKAKAIFEASKYRGQIDQD